MMNPKEIKRLKDYATLPFIISIIMFFAPTFIVDPQSDNLQTTEEGFDRVINAARASIKQRADDQVLSIKMEKMGKELSKIDSWVPAESFLPQLVDEVNELAQICSVKILSTTYRTERAPDDPLPPRISISIQLSADYRGMKVFLTALEALPSPVILTEVVANENRTFTVSLIQLVKP